MLFNSFFGKPKEQSPRPPWVNWIIVLAVVYVLVQGLTKGEQQEYMTPVQKAIDSAEKSFTNNKIIDFNSYKQQIFPQYRAKFFSKDIIVGKGPSAFCGQNVAIAYTAYREDGTPIDDSATKAKPLRFHLGSDAVMPVFEKAVATMRVGGKRRVAAPLSMSYGIKKFARNDILSNEEVYFDVELLRASPAIPDTKLKGFRIAEVQTKYGAPIECGQNVRVNMIVWDVAGNKLFSTASNTKSKPPTKTKPETQDNVDTSSSPEGISFTVGKSEVFFGLEQGILGMAKNSVRTLIIPPAMQKTLDGRKPKIAIPFPENQTVLVDVEYLP